MAGPTGWQSVQLPQRCKTNLPPPPGTAFLPLCMPLATRPEQLCNPARLLVVCCSCRAPSARMSRTRCWGPGRSWWSAGCQRRGGGQAGVALASGQLAGPECRDGRATVYCGMVCATWAAVRLEQGMPGPRAAGPQAQQQSACAVVTVRLHLPARVAACRRTWWALARHT